MMFRNKDCFTRLAGLIGLMTAIGCGDVRTYQIDWSSDGVEFSFSRGEVDRSFAHSSTKRLVVDHSSVTPELVSGELPLAVLIESSIPTRAETIAGEDCFVYETPNRSGVDDPGCFYTYNDSGALCFSEDLTRLISAHVEVISFRVCDDDTPDFSTTQVWAGKGVEVPQ